MNPPALPAAPWHPSPIPGSRAVITGDGCILLNLEGIPDATPEQAAAFRRAVAALPDCLAALATIHANAAESPEWIRRHTAAALTKAGYTATVPPTATK